MKTSVEPRVTRAAKSLLRELELHLDLQGKMIKVYRDAIDSGRFDSYQSTAGL
jgi:hypothetical protein